MMRTRRRNRPTGTTHFLSSHFAISATVKPRVVTPSTVKESPTVGVAFAIGALAGLRPER
jgi:hypothetical protein